MPGTMKLLLALLLAILPVAFAQDLVSALAVYPQLSQFSALLRKRASLFPASNGESITVLVPDNTAFERYKAATSKDLASLDDGTLRVLLEYHSLTGALTATDFQKKGGLIVPTLLKDPKYDLRNPANGATPGQVVFVDMMEGSTVKIRQVSLGADFVQSGAGNQVTLELIDGVWSGGRFQVIDDVLTLPVSCSDTFDLKGLMSLQTALTRSNLTETLNNFPDVVCLAPNDNAFHQSGGPDVNASPATLADALKFHTIAGPGYSTGLSNGQKLMSVNNLPILVTILGDGTIFFNDAKVIAQNVIVKNGAVHILDKIMSPLGSFDPKTLGTASSVSTSAGPTSTDKATSTSSGSASATSTAKPNSCAAFAVRFEFVLALFLASIAWTQAI